MYCVIICYFEINGTAKGYNMQRINRKKLQKEIIYSTFIDRSLIQNSKGYFLLLKILRNNEQTELFYLGKLHIGLV